MGSLVARATVILVALSASAHADPKADVQAKLKAAMESYDLMDYDASRKLLTQALAAAKKAKLDKDPLVARAYLDLGIVSFANSDADGAKQSFLSAVQIEPKIQIDAAYKSAEMAKLLDQVRGEAGGSAGGEASEPVVATGPAVDCSSVKGLQHTLVDTAAGGKALPIDAALGADVKATKVVVMYRVEGAAEFTEIKLAKSGCKYSGQIPASAMKGGLVHYYVAAYGEGIKPVASKGSAGSPNIIEITAAAGGNPVKGDEEDPIKQTKPAGGGGGGDGDVSATVTVGPRPTHIFVAVSGGTGFGYLSGTTEGNNMVKSGGLGSSLAVVMPELGYYISPRMTISAVVRIGFPLGANVDGHATASPGGLLRLRYGLSPSGDGARVMAEVGYGVLRNTIKLDNSMPGMDTDVVAQGPLLVGGGIGYSKRIAGNVALIADLSALAGIANVKSTSWAPALNTGVSADLSLGLAVGF